MIHYTHICMNCGPALAGDITGLTGAATNIDRYGRCERCDSEAVTPILSEEETAAVDERIRQQTLDALRAFIEDSRREFEAWLE
jgi:hypothetical protein